MVGREVQRDDRATLMDAEDAILRAQSAARRAESKATDFAYNQAEMWARVSLAFSQIALAKIRFAEWNGR